MARRNQQRAGRSAPIIRREEVTEHGGHGSGAWKVAYADFVTALMAFFLLMWLMNATTEDQRKGLADYFSPTNLLSHNSSGTGQPFGGHTAFDSGALLSDRGVLQLMPGKRPVMSDAEEPEDDPPVVTNPHAAAARKEAPKPANGSAQADAAVQAQENGSAAQASARASGQAQQADVSQSDNGKNAEAAAKKAAREAQAAEKAQAEREAKAFQAAAQELQKAVAGDPGLAGLMDHLSVDITPEGLRIQILDTQNQSLFPFGSAQPNDTARVLLGRIAPLLLKLPEQVVIQGHTDAAPYPGPTMTNWELSASRANAARRLLSDAGLPDKRIKEVTGQADHALLLPADPLAAANRRIAILVLRGTGATVAAKTGPPSAAGGP